MLSGADHRLSASLNCALACRVDCPAFQIPAALMVKHEELVFAALEAMRPAAELQTVLSRYDFEFSSDGGCASRLLNPRSCRFACSVQGSLRSMSANQTYNLLHLRAEEDWISHCARWGRIRDGELPPVMECRLRCVSCVHWHHLNPCCCCALSSSSQAWCATIA